MKLSSFVFCFLLFGGRGFKQIFYLKSLLSKYQHKDVTIRIIIMTGIIFSSQRTFETTH